MILNYSLFIALLLFLCEVHCCSRTTPTPTPTVNPADCGVANLVQTPTPSNLPDGQMTFNYDDPDCPRIVSATCSTFDAASNLYAGIIANQFNYLEYGQTTVSFTGTWMDGAWYMGTPPLLIETLECVLTNPP